VDALVIAIALLIVALALCIRFILPRQVWTELLAEVIHDGLQGVWHVIFGPRKVRIVRERRSRAAGFVERQKETRRKKSAPD